ncbi:MFS transporter [Umezawaea beigongshangensis]|uniref:MFS transporter n=1 Tax=Umezawaea beigongshangensis TaxID=2780383 RepID=UPI0018F10BE5|nr:MFS transporter [Umezawaea beigongshangensis]
MSTRPAVVPLSRNRDYTVLWTGQLCSELAVELVLVALPLLVLARTGSALQVGVVGSALATATLLAAIPAGSAVDRWDRRTLLLCCQAGRVAAHATLVVALVGGGFPLALVLIALVVEGVLGSVFDPAEHAALPSVVPAPQLPLAVARNAARPYLATLLGPALAGLLFTLDPVWPFAAALAVLGLSAAGLLLLRLPARPAARTPLGRGGTGAGLRWVWRTRSIRATLVWQALTNLVFNAVVVVVLALSHENGASSGELGLVVACLGAGGVLGALVAARVSTALPPAAAVLGFAWLVTVAVGAMAFVPAGLPAGLLLGCAALLAPVANTAVSTHQLVVTPDELRGRMSATCGFGTGGAAAAGPVLGGALVAATGDGGTALALCAVAFGLLAAGATASRTLRRFAG